MAPSRAGVSLEANSITTDRRRSGHEILVALGLSTGALVALGFTRFAYALLLPPMRSELEWSFTASGGMNTSNAIGYILGAAIAAWFARRIGAKVAFIVGIALSAIALVACGLTSEYAILSSLRFIGGVATAVTFVLGSALAARAHAGGSQRRSAVLVSVYMAGVGLGIVASGLIVPAVLSTWGPAAWGTGWIVMGVIAASLIVPAAWAAYQVQDAPSAPRGGSRIRWRPLSALFVWYVLFGAGYVSYMTFVVALLREQQFSDGQVAVFFTVLGVASVVATLTIWGRVIGRMRRGHAPSIISIVVLIGVLPVLVGEGLLAALLSAVIFGSGFMAGPTAATVLARRSLPPHGWTPGIALLTVAFSVGQAVGPLLAGALSDVNGGIEVGLWLSVGLLAAAAVVSLIQRDVTPNVARHPSVAAPSTAAAPR
jgi:predicted MFS family arabinose efflux permease